MNLLLAIALLAAPPPTPSYVRIQEAGTTVGVVQTLNFSSGATCSASGVTATCSISGGGGGSSGAPLDAGYWVSQADSRLTNEKNLGALATGLVVNTAGVPSAYAGASCVAGRFVTAVSASGALTCDAGTPTAPGGNTTEVQYNNAGAFGGIANFETDGTRPSIVTETAHPAAPASNRLTYDFRSAAGLPSVPWGVDSTVDLAMPDGLLADFSFSGTSINWVEGCVTPAVWAGASLLNVGLNTPSVIAGSGAVVWATTNLLSRSRVVSFTSSGAINTNGGVKENNTNQTGIWRGDSAGAGGFVFWHRFAVMVGVANSRIAVGMFGTTAALTSTANPNAATNSVYMGCNAGDSNFSICSNDATSTATCTTLGASFPCTTSNALYDVWFVAAPNASDVSYYVERLDSAATASGTISSDLPLNTVQMSWQHWVNTGSQTGIVRTGFLRVCIALNY